MKFSMGNILLLAFAFLTAVPATAAEVAGVKLEERVRVGDADLLLNGAGVRTRFLFKVYVAGLYLPQATHDSGTALESSGMKRMSLVMLREVSKESLLEAMRDGIRKNTLEAELPALAAPTEKMESLFASIASARKGDALVFDFNAEGVTLSLNGQVLGRVDGGAFAQALLKVWLGGHPVDAALKKSLLSD